MIPMDCGIKKFSQIVTGDDKCGICPETKLFSENR
jgi:hypothetical protein